MLRSAAKRAVVGSLVIVNSTLLLRNPHRLAIIHTSGFCTSATGQSQFTNQSPNNHSHNPTIQSAAAASGAQSSSPNPEASSTAEEETRRFDGHRSGRRGNEYKEEQVRVLRASLPHVNRLGWSEAAMMAGAREIGVSPSIVGSFPRKEAAHVEHFMDECLERLIDIIESDQELQNLVPSERIIKLVRTRLEMQVPYISRWAQALSIQALPMNVQSSFKQRAMLIDEILHAAAGDSSDMDWFVKRTVLGGIYSMAEVYMLTDSSQDFVDTWAFLDARVRDFFDLKKTIREAQYIAESAGAGIGVSLQGLARKVFQL